MSSDRSGLPPAASDHATGVETDDAAAEQPRAPKLWRRHGFALVGLSLSVVLLWWALRDTSLAAVWERARAADPLLLALAVAGGVVTLLLRAIRWKEAIRHLAPDARLADVYHATSIGAMANNLLPARAGEIVGSATLARLTGIRLAAAGSSLVIVHVLDVLVLGILGAGALVLYPRDELVGSAETVQDVVIGGIVLSTVVIAIAIGVARAMARNPSLAARLPERILRIIEAGIDGVRSLAASGSALRVAGWTIGLWVFDAFVWWAGLQALDIDIGLRAAFVAQTVVAFAIALPAAPGFFGPFESATRIALALFVVDAAAGAEAAVGFHVAVFFVPVVIAGFVSLALADLSLRTLRDAGGPST